jgi:adenylate cyclase
MGERLSATDGFRVVPYSKLSGLSALADSNSIGRDARVDLALTGRLYRDKGDLAVETRLVDTSDGQLLRITSRTIDVTQLQATESDLLEQMFSGLEIRPFTETSDPDRLSRETKNNEAFRLNLVGRHFWRKRDPENLQKAIAAFKQAIDMDPGYSRAYAGLADSYVLMSSVAYGAIPPKEAYSRARVAAKQAIEIDPLNAEAHISLGVILARNDWNWGEAERCYRRAIEIDPDNGAAYFWFSGLLGITGRVEESIAAAEKAKELDPFSGLVEYNLARLYYYAREYDRSLKILSSQTIIEQDDTKILYLKGLNYIQQGLLAKALSTFQTISEKNRMLGIAAMGYTLGKMGRRSDALRLIAELENDSNGKYVPPQEIAIIYIGLGENDKAFQYLYRSLDERFGPLSAIKVEPLFDPIRDDVRFADLLRKMALDRAQNLEGFGRRRPVVGSFA